MPMRPVRYALALAGAVFVSMGPCLAEAQRSAARAPSCPSGSSWVDAERACVGTPRCPPGSHADGSGACLVDAVRCPEGTQSDGDACTRPAVCPEGTTAEGEHCVRPAPSCAEGSTLVEGRCVVQALSCPAGAQLDANGRCVGSVACPSGFVYESGTGCVLERPRVETRPTTVRCTDEAVPRLISHDVPHVEARAGFGYGGYDLVDRGARAPSTVPTGYFGGAVFRASLGFNYESLAFTVNYQHLFADTGLGNSFNQLTGEILARCACWSSFYQWRLGVELGYDLSAHSIVLNGVHLSQFNIKHGVFVGLEARAGGLIGELSDGPTAIGASGTLFVGYQR